ncbi:hypothetical protein HOA55_05160 [archaeon]|jgi:hypothetical protein|nr:hypothetical protein [archaeon]MBT3577710.1 hypothetical protein [archaeon]MBT6820717.1 hypothetical protein [archaeon]MBT6956034.1 hypothetical protein [archaeon]MBT7025857.1 hypothetical protein [archaeon]
MEKDIGKIQKNPETDIIVRIDDFGGKRGLTIREFVHSERYTGFTKAGVRIRAENFEEFKEMINSVNLEEIKAELEEAQESLPKTAEAPEADDEPSGIDENGLM